MLVLALLAGAACAVPSPERQVLQSFFAACEVYDITAMARFGEASCNPRTDGVVESFEIADRRDGVVTIAAQVRRLEGGLQDEVLRIELAEGERGPMVRAITRLPASRTSPAASSAPPK
jgi:hypothetical protein